MTLHGYDISAYQGTTAPAGDFVIVKATEGASYTSSKFKAQYASAKSKAKHRGAYHFARPEQSTYKDQAARFLDVVQPEVGESVWLDLEASKLSQAATNTWARGWGDYMHDHAPGITFGVYLGSGYVSNNTGRDLSKHFDLWWYPQYPGAYQVANMVGIDLEELRAENRSSLIPERHLIAATTTKWPPAVTPWLPATNNTGWKSPDVWQFTDNWQGLDASVTALTIAQLASGNTPPPPAPQPKPWPGRYLKLASPLMHGSDVKWVQRHLNSHGAKVTVDSEYGPKTRTAVALFQGTHKLDTDGVVGKLTWTALGKS
jgi:hypothetical protein